MIPQDFSIVFFFFEGGKRGVFVIASAFKSFILKLNMKHPWIILGRFVQDCRLIGIAT